MIDNSERREVAARLRGLKEHTDEAPLIFTEQVHNAMALRTIRAVIGRGDIFQRLADLIDRPTCKNLATHLVDEFVCSACGERVDIAYLDSEDDYRVRYCPRCGAFVRSDNE